ncbi:MAG TPA: hypothetical protein VHK70_00060, partial [Burkholderiaceae bacterium]|nr:hypothetical protein [Burkholderiaceae bacterium]
MVISRIKASSRAIALAKGLLLHGLLVPAVHAADTAPQPAADLLLIAAAGDSHLAESHDTDLFLELKLNGMPRGLAQFVLRDAELWTSAATLRQLGFMLPASSSGMVRLRDLPGVQVEYDSERQSVAITAPLTLLHLPTTLIGTPGTPAQAASASPGLLLNYDLYGTRGSGNTASMNAFTEIRA